MNEEVGRNVRVDGREVGRKEVMSTSKKMKRAKPAGLKGVMVKILKCGGVSGI